MFNQKPKRIRLVASVVLTNMSKATGLTKYNANGAQINLVEK